MGMVLDAEGLDGSEKLLLIGYTNWTDPYGYCWPSEQRLADSCGTSRSTVQRVKRKLVKKKLLKSVRRTTSKGEPISNLSRVNLPLLASMARKRTAYDDNLIDAITFDDDTQGDPEATLRGTPDDPETPSDLLTRQSDSYPESNRLLPRVKMTPTPSQIDSQSRSYPEEIPLSHPSARTRGRVGAAAGDEREKIAPPKRRTGKPATLGGVMGDATPRRQAAAPEPAVAEVPEQREPSDKDAAAGGRIVAAYAAALGRPVLDDTQAKLQAQAVTLLAKGYTESWLCARVREMAPKGWKDLIMHVDHARQPLPTHTASPSAAVGLPEWCGQCGGGTDSTGEPYQPGVRFNPRWRTVDADGGGEKCPRCHPERVSATV